MRVRHAKLVQAGLVAFVWFAGTVRWLIGSLTGLLFVLIALWWYLRWNGPDKPLGSRELVLWFEDQRDDVKLALAAMLLTLMGFMIAFWTASMTWRRQKELELRIEASKAVHARFERALRSINSIEAYLHVLNNAITAAKSMLPAPGARSHLVFINSRAEAFANDRQGLFAAMLDVYELYGEFAGIFANVIGVEKDIKRAARAIEIAQEKLGAFSPPHADPDDLSFVQSFLTRCDIDALNAAHGQCAQSRGDASRFSGKAGGKLTAAVIKPNLLALISFTRNRHIISELLSKKPLD
jgi:hypothetical protein